MQAHAGLGMTISAERVRRRLTDFREGWRHTDGPPKPTADDIAYGQIVYHDPCAYCGGLAGILDHIVHAEHGWTNLTPACKRCNSSKGQHSLLRYLAAKQLRAQRTTSPDQKHATIQQIRALGQSHGNRYGGPRGQQ